MTTEGNGSGEADPKHPPRARLAVRVGVTGHQLKRLHGMNEVLLRSRIRAVLQSVADVAGSVHDRHRGPAGYADEPPLLRVVSPIADGADSIVAEQAVDLGYQLHCPVPFAEEVYRQTIVEKQLGDDVLALHDRLWREAGPRFELDGSRDEPELEKDAYLAVGELVLRQCDVLIAIWDGAPADGRGGTGDIVAAALRLELPVVWIHAAPPHAVTPPPDRLRREPPTAARPAPADGAGAARPPDLQFLDAALRQQLEPPVPAADRHHGPDLRRTYFHETQPKATYLGWVYACFRKLVLTGWPGVPKTSVPDAAANPPWTPQPPAAGDAPKTEGFASVLAWMRQQYGRHYGWADMLADYYAGLYRSAFIVNFLLGAFSVLFAILVFADKAGKAWWIGIEVGLLAMILVLTIAGWRQKWHQRWLDYRLLAEELRHMFFLAPLGRAALLARVPPHMEHDDPAETWVQWHLRAVVRQAGLPDARLTSGYLDDYATWLQETHIRGQIDYHSANARISGRLFRRLQWIGVGLFGATLVIGLLKLTGFLHPSLKVFLDPPLGTVATLLAGVLPAFGAALAGIRSQGEFERLAERSHGMAAALLHLDDRLSRLPRPWRATEMAPIAVRTAETMAAELMDWRVVFRAKPLELP